MENIKYLLVATYNDSTRAYRDFVNGENSGNYFIEKCKETLQLRWSTCF
jgi:hypothetical protein